MNHPTANRSNLQQIAASILSSIEWHDGVTGFCKCPGESLHTHPTHRRDCRVKLDGAPTISCFHTSCSAEVESANHLLRSLVGKAHAGSNLEFNRREAIPEERERERRRILREQLRSRAVTSLPELLRRYAMGPADFFELSPVRLTDDQRKDQLVTYGARLQGIFSELPIDVGIY